MLFLVALLALFGYACGNGDDDDGETTGDEVPALTDDAGTGGAGTGGADASPGPMSSPDSSPATTDEDFTGGGAIYDETPSVEP